MHSFHFDDQYNTFHSYGYAVAPGGQAVVGDEEALADKKGAASPQGTCELPITLKRPLSSFFHTGLPTISTILGALGGVEGQWVTHHWLSLKPLIIFCRCHLIKSLHEFYMKIDFITHDRSWSRIVHPSHSAFTVRVQGHAPTQIMQDGVGRCIFQDRQCHF
jgi:hypothetical protein